MRQMSCRRSRSCCCNRPRRYGLRGTSTKLSRCSGRPVQIRSSAWSKFRISSGPASSSPRRRPGSRAKAARPPKHGTGLRAQRPRRARDAHARSRAPGPVRRRCPRLQDGALRFRSMSTPRTTCASSRRCCAARDELDTRDRAAAREREPPGRAGGSADGRHSTASAAWPSCS